MNDDIYASLPSDLAAALRRCDLLIGKEQLEYIYNLYDPETGGFYYSISSRDAEEMTPFAEGTAFAIEALCSGGMTLPDWYKKKVSVWILSHQDQGDGFFYEELWGKLTSINPGPRISRDLGASTGILESCGVEPLYPLPVERMKDGSGSSALPAYLESRETMLAYLDSLDWSTKSIWSTGQKLAMAEQFIVPAGHLELVHDYIKSKQNPDTGLWGEGLGWMNTNGAMKVSRYFLHPGYSYPNPVLAVESIIKLYTGDTPPSGATYIWNPLVLINRIIETAGDKRDELRQMLLVRGAEIVNRAVDSALLLHRADGGFSGSIQRGGNRQQGFLYGYGYPDESDLDGTLIAGKRLRTHIHRVFDVPETKGYYAEYNDAFWEAIKNKPPIKKTLPRPPGNISLDDAVNAVAAGMAKKSQ